MFSGYYCPPGQNNSSPFPCDPGYYCPEGSFDMTLCEAGTYQEASARGTCHPCNAGYYCDFADAPLTDYTSYPCPQGHFCPNGTEYSTQYPCPAGTYGPGTMLEEEAQCTSCDAGKYCGTTGRTAVSGR